MVRIQLLFCGLPALSAHGSITWPPARNNATIAKAGNSLDFEAFWFSQPVSIPSGPTLPHFARSFNTDVATGEPHDFTATMPWRAPGSAPVYGSGCGAAGGGPFANMSENGGDPPAGYAQGADFLSIPASAHPTAWPAGSVQEVAWSAMANHGGGYSWRLCKNSGETGGVSEACFQRTPLRFVGNTSTVRYGDMIQWGVPAALPDFEIPRLSVTAGTHPPGSEWARMPIPACRLCTAPVHAACAQEAAWLDQQHCSQACSGINMTHCPPTLVQFPEPLHGLSGFDPMRGNSGLIGLEYSIVDRVQVPAGLEKGAYLLSWRWDCEQSHQIWQNCADIRIT